METCIDLTGPNTIARTTLEDMSEKKKSSLQKKIGSTLQMKLNKNVRDAILDEAHFELLAKLNCEHRTKNVVSVSSMMHPLKPTMDKLLGTAHALKVGGTIPIYKTAAKNDDPSAVHRQPEWRQYPSRVQSIQTCSI